MNISYIILLTEKLENNIKLRKLSENIQDETYENLDYLIENGCILQKDCENEAEYNKIVQAICNNILFLYPGDDGIKLVTKDEINESIRRIDG